MSEKYPCIICGNEIDRNELNMLEVRRYKTFDDSMWSQQAGLFAFLCPTCTKKAINEITKAVYGLKKKEKTNV